MGAEKIKRTRLEKGMSQVELANRSGLPKQRIYDLESGRVSWDKTTVRTAQKIAHALSCTIDDFCD